MKLHIVPKILERNCYVEIELVDVTIPELDLTLRNNKEIVARRPYPNKYYQVACRKVGKRAVNGILIETDKELTEFTVVTKWRIDGEDVITHECHNTIVDAEHELVSQDFMLWHATKNFENRMPESMMKEAPVNMCARMDHVQEPTNLNKMLTVVEDTLKFGKVIHRLQKLDLPSVELARMEEEVFNPYRLPKDEDKFIA